MKKKYYLIIISFFVIFGLVLQHKEANKFDEFSRDVASTETSYYGKGTIPISEMFQWSWDKNGSYIDGAFKHKFNDKIDNKISLYKINNYKYEVMFDIKDTASYVLLNGNIIQKFEAEVNTLSENECVNKLNQLNQKIEELYGNSKHLKIIERNMYYNKIYLGNSNYMDMKCNNFKLNIVLYQL